MAQHGKSRLMVAAALTAAAGMPVSLLGRQDAQPASAPADVPAVPANAPSPVPEIAPKPEPAASPSQPAADADGQPRDEIRFSFKEAPFDQVLDFFSRESGLPVIREAQVPQGAITFIGAKPYSFEEGLSILNLNLAMHGVHLRRQENFLYLATLTDAAKRANQVTRGDIPADMPPDQILTITIPLVNAMSDVVVEQIKPLIGAYGAVQSVPAQNMLILVESAAQCRRIKEVVSAIDQQRPVDSEYKFFRLKHADPEPVVAALKGLVGERQKTVIVDPNGKQRIVEEQVVSGLTMTADPRTRSVIVVGSRSRIQTVEELIGILDVPEGGDGATSMLTFAMRTITPESAAEKVNALFANAQGSVKPIVLPLPESGKLTVVAAQPQLAQVSMLLAEVDPGSGTAQSGAQPESRTIVARLKHLTPVQAQQVVTQLLTARQSRVLKFAASPDGSGLIVSGPDADVGAIETLIAGMDVPSTADREARLVRIGGDDPVRSLARAQALYAQTGQSERAPVTASLEAESRTATLIGSGAALAQFEKVLAQSQSAAASDTEARTFTLKVAKPSTLAGRLTRLAGPLLAPDDGSAYVPPRIEGLDELRRLVVRAQASQFAVIEGLIAQLDAEEPGSRDFRVVRVPGDDPGATLQRAQELYQTRSAGLTDEEAGQVVAELDPASGAVLITARPGGMRLFTQILEQVQQLAPPARVTRVVEVVNVPATDIVEPLRQMLASADSIEPSRKLPEPAIQVIERTNSLLITAEPVQQDMIRDFLARLDRIQPGDMPPLRLLQLRTADAAGVATMLTQQYGQRSQADRAAKPVDVRADAATNTLIVSAHADLFEEIRAFVSDINKEQPQGGERVTQVFPLKVARAVDVAAALDKLYPQPPMPVDRLNRPMPWAQQPKEVTVSADAASNVLMINAPADRMESIQALAEKLDRVELPPAALLRTYRITGQNLDAISRTLLGMSGKGMLVGPAQPGKPQVQVLIETEPKSNTLIVAGDETTFERVEAMLKDLSAIPVEKTLRVFPIVSAKATELKVRAQGIYDAQIAQIPGANPAEVSVDESSNSLMVVADVEAMTRMAKIIDELNRQAGPAREMRMIELKVAKATEVVGFLEDLVRSSESMMIRGGPDPVFEAIEATNSILVAAQPVQFAVIEALAKSLDSRQTGDRQPMRILRLTTSDAANLAQVLQLSYDQRPIEQRGRMPVEIRADQGTNTLIVSAHPDILNEIGAIVAELNETQATGADGREIRIFPLKVARAEELALTLDQMFPEPPVPLEPRTRQPRPDLKPAREVVVRADRGTNALIVDAPAKRLVGFEQLVKSLDQQKLGENVELRTYRVERANLLAVTAALTNLARSGTLTAGQASATAAVTVDSEPTSKSIIVSGPSAIFPRVEALLKEMDALPAAPPTGLKMYALQKARAERLQPLVQKVLESRLRELRQPDGSPLPESAKVLEVVSDAASNTLVVSAPEAILIVADGLVKSLDQSSEATGVEVRVFRLEKGDAESAGKAIQTALTAKAEPGEPAASVTPESASNTIVVVGTQRQIQQAADLISSLDVSVDPVGMGVRTIMLKHARAEALAPVLQGVLERESPLANMPFWARAEVLARGGGQESPVRVVADGRRNAVVISGSKATLDLAEQIIASLDAPADASAARRDIRIITLRNADAQQVATNVGQVLKDEGTLAEPATVLVDPQSNSLIVRGTTEQLAAIETLVGRLDAATLSSTRQMRMIPIDKSRADAEMMAQTLKRLLEQQGVGRVEVISTQELLRRQKNGGGDKNPDDQPPKQGKSSRRDSSPGLGAALPGFPGFVAKGVVAGAMAKFEPEPSAPQAPAQPEQPSPADVEQQPGITIAVDPATNSLMVIGSPRLTDRIAALVAELEREMPPEPTKVHVVTLPPNADSQSIAQIARQTAEQIGKRGPQNPGGFTGAMSVLADPAGGAIIVLANDTDFQTVGTLIASITQLDATADLTIKVYPLSSISAQRAKEAVDDLFSSTPRGQQARRMRAVDVTVQGPDGQPTAQGKLDPSTLRMAADPSGSALIVAAPAEAIPLIDGFLGLIDQSQVQDRLSIRRYTLSFARADGLATTLQQLFEAQRQGPNAEELPRAKFVADERTNSMLVTASEAQHADVKRLLQTADATAEHPDQELAIIALQSASPTVVREIVEHVVIGKDEAKAERIRLSVDESSSLFVVRAGKDEIAQIRAIVAQVDSAAVSGLPVRSVKLERADAQSVAQALQRFFQDRAAISAKPGQRNVNKVAIVGDRRTSTLVCAASDEDFEQIKSLISTFDAPAPARDMQFHVIPLKHARVTDIADTLENISWQLRDDQMYWNPWRPSNQDQPSDKLVIETNERLNSVILMGQGENIATMERVIAQLDAPESERTALTVKAVPVQRADLQAIKSVIERSLATPGWPRWRGPDPDAVTVEIDKARRAVLLVGKATQVEKAMKYVTELDGAGGAGEQKIESIALQHARADRAARSLSQFFEERARIQGLPDTGVSIIGSADGNVLFVSADEANLAVLRTLVAQVDKPELGDDRRVEFYVMQNSVASEAAATLRAMFPRSGRAEEQVVITPQESTNTLIVSAPVSMYEQIETWVKQLDTPPTAENANMMTVTLGAARAVDVAAAVKAALPASVKVTITPVARSNSLILTGSPEAITLVMEQINKIDTQPARPMMAIRRIKLENAMADDVSYTLGQMLRARPRGSDEPAATVDYNRSDNTLIISAPADQIEQVAQMIADLDVPALRERKTEFVPLEFAKAEQTAKALEVFYGRYAPEAATPGARNVTIVADPTSNSLVISADEKEWEGIRALLKKLDDEKYDASRQFEVIALRHADAPSVARALNEGLRGPVEDEFRRRQAEQERRNRGGRPEDAFPVAPTVLVDAEGNPTVSAEEKTNALIVFAGRRDMERIKGIVAQLDVPDFAKLADVRLISLKVGKPSVVAQLIRELYLNQTARVNGPRSVLIQGDDATGTLIVRADEEQFAHIKALAQTLEQQGEIGRVRPFVIRLKNVPAARLRDTLVKTFTPVAAQMGESMAVEIDRTSNALVIASSPRLREEIEKTVAELDGLGVGGADAPDQVNGAARLGQSVFIIDVQNLSPSEVKTLLEEMGLTRPQAEDRPGVVTEPVTIVPMTTRRAIAVLATPGDGPAVTSLVRALDAAPAEPDQTVAVVPLKLASAEPLVQMLTTMLTPAGENGGTTGAAKALAEQVRRIGMTLTSLDQKDLKVDLAKPLRLIADQGSNSVLIASTPGNVEAIRQVVEMLDTLPVGDAVVMRIFPLQNASAIRIKTVIDQLFQQGEALRRLPGTQRQGLPPTATGRALAGEIAISVDERTNVMVVAGRDEAVALVEVLIKDLDSDETSKWIEPAVIALRHADAVSLGRKLKEVLITGLSADPEGMGLQKAFGRLRLVQQGKDPSQPGAAIQADLFAPLTGLVITPEEQTNSLIVVGSPSNLEVVKQLVAMLDVEAAGAANEVRIFALKFAAAERVGAMLRDIFTQRQSVETAREEDKLIVTSDARTNSLVISTSPRSLVIVESLLRTLDGEQANYSVNLHVLPVENADVRQLAPKIERLMQDRIAAATRAGGVSNPMDAFSIEAEPTNSLLIVSCSDENLLVVKELLKALTADAVRVAGADRTELIQLTRMPAAEAVEAIREMYVDRENERRGPNSVSITANDRLNMLVVNGTEADIASIRAKVEALDKAKATLVREMQRIELRSANALEVVRLLENALAGRPVSGDRTAGVKQATILRFVRQKVADELRDATGAVTEAELDGAIRDHVTLTPDLRSNSVVVAAPPEVLVLIRDMIEDLDSTSAGARKIERFHLTNADARAMAELLRDVFNLRQQGESFVLIPTNVEKPEDPTATPEGAFSTGVTAVPDERKALSIAIDGRTNTLLVSGTEEYLELVSKVVNELDQIEATERERTVYHLRNAKAKEIETTLQTYFEGESSLQREILGPQLTGSLARQLEQEVTIVGDEKSNKLVISSSPRYTETVLKIVKELDATPPQVMVQVLLAEVSLDAEANWGMDISVGPLGSQGLRMSSLGGGAGITTALGVPNLSVSAADFGLLIRALQAQGKLEVLSNPQIIVNNNETATMSVGENVAVTSGSEVTPQGGTRAQVERKDLGIKLNVTPSISADGYVRMDIKPEISALTTRTTQISEDLSTPIINNRLFETTVTVKDGQSVVIGGLIQSAEEERVTKVPILGDIPILGLPFRTNKKQTVKTELLVILTPRVVPGQAIDAEARVERLNEQFLDRLEDSSKLRRYIEDLKEQYGIPNDPASGPAEAPISPETPDLPMAPGEAPAATRIQSRPVGTSSAAAGTDRRR